MFKIILSLILSSALMASMAEKSEDNVEKTVLIQTAEVRNHHVSNTKQNIEEKSTTVSKVKNENTDTSTTDEDKTKKFDREMPWLSLIAIFSIIIVLIFLKNPLKKKYRLSYFEKLIALKDMKRAISNNKKHKEYNCKEKDKLTCIIDWFVYIVKKDTKDYKQKEKDAYEIKVWIVITSIALGFMSTASILWNYNSNEFPHVFEVLAFIVLVFSGTIFSLAALVSSSDRMINLSPIRLISKVLFYILKKAFEGLRWIKRPVEKLPNQDQINNIDLSHRDIFSRIEDFLNLFSNDVKKWLIFTYIQLIAFSFSIGLALGMLVPSDAAFVWFGWSDDLSKVFSWASFWSPVSPEFAPSIDLIEKTYVNTADDIKEKILPYLHLAAEWWKFIFMSIVVYGIIPRIVLWKIGQQRLEKAIDRSIESISGAETLYHRLRDGSVSFDNKGRKPVVPFEEKDLNNLSNGLEGVMEKKREPVSSNSDLEHKLYTNEESDNQPIVLWNIELEDAKVVEDDYGINLIDTVAAGGENDFEDDVDIAQGMEGKITIVVSSWTPSIDIDDFLETLESNEKVEKIRFILARLPDHSKVKGDDLEVWTNKIDTFKNMWIKESR